MTGKKATGESHAPSKSDCQESPKAEKTQWSHNLRVSPASVHDVEAVFSIVREVYGRGHDDLVDDFGRACCYLEHFWIPLAAVRLGPDHDANLHYVKFLLKCALPLRGVATSERTLAGDFRSHTRQP